MAMVDADNDSIERYVVYHYRYDSARHERRHVIVAAFDNEREFEECLEKTEAEISRRRENGEDVNPQEHVSGTVHEPGYQRRQRNARNVRRAMNHGVPPANWEEYELPSNFGVLSAGEPQRPRRRGLTIFRILRVIRDRVKPRIGH